MEVVLFKVALLVLIRLVSGPVLPCCMELAYLGLLPVLTSRLLTTLVSP